MASWIGNFSYICDSVNAQNCLFILLVLWFVCVGVRHVSTRFALLPLGEIVDRVISARLMVSNREVNMGA